MKVLRKTRKEVLSSTIRDLNSDYHLLAGYDAPVRPGDLFTTDDSIGRITPADYLILTSAAIKVQRSERLSDVEVDMVADVIARMGDAK